MNGEYLTQKGLEKFLGNHFNIETEWKIPNTRFKIDIKFTHKGKTYGVEFDGMNHYMDNDIVLSDRRKNSSMMDLDIIPVRFPYWLQLTTTTFTHLFGFMPPVILEQVYPHGFIDKNSKSPASFCVGGIKRFCSEMNDILSFDVDTFLDICVSFTCHPKYKTTESMLDEVIATPFILEKVENLFYDPHTTKEQKSKIVQVVEMFECYKLPKMTLNMVKRTYPELLFSHLKNRPSVGLSSEIEGLLPMDGPKGMEFALKFNE